MPWLESDAAGLDAAIAEAAAGLAEGGVPIGSSMFINTFSSPVIESTAGGIELGRGRNRRVQQNSAILHGEIDCIQNAGRLKADTYSKATLYTTLSPCAMCSGAILLFGIKRVVVAEHDTFQGEDELLKSRGVEVIEAPDAYRAQCRAMMETFIREKPDVWAEDISVEEDTLKSKS